VLCPAIRTFVKIFFNDVQFLSSGSPPPLAIDTIGNITSSLLSSIAGRCVEAYLGRIERRALRYWRLWWDLWLVGGWRRRTWGRRHLLKVSRVLRIVDRKQLVHVGARLVRGPVRAGEFEVRIISAKFERR
jgi:hypothetical protein